MRVCAASVGVDFSVINFILYETMAGRRVCVWWWGVGVCVCVGMCGWPPEDGLGADIARSQ